ncbi:MAG TPA: peptide chain release factor N(5)-glutamine methyltransferase [Desulfobacterales bacterium]|nr:peptide chain release factor N(5)-glutamine methyltransferase [Desulfobacterales bacterium]
MPPTLAQRLQEIAAILTRAGIDDPRREATLLLGHFLDLSPTELLLRGDEKIPAPAGLATAVERRAKREPLAYILGKTDFYDITLQVSPAVLVPRPETELLVEETLARIANDRPSRWLDAGTGSGAIGIVLARQRPQTTVIGIDASMAALKVAAGNQQRLTGHLRLLAADGRHLPFASHCFDGIVANLPYVAAADLIGLAPEVRDFEPRSALDGGPRGVELYLACLPEFHRVLRPGGHLLFEIGADQADIFRHHLTPAAGFEQAEIVRDYAGLPRIVRCRRCA